MTHEGAPGRGRFFRVAKTVFITLATLCVAAILGTVLPRPLFRTADAGPDGPERRVRLLYNPIHTDIAFPADADVLERFSFLGSSGLPIEHPEVRWIIVGWGGRSFYLETPTWADLKPAPVIKAFTIDSSVMHVSLAAGFDTDRPGVDELIMSPARFATMLDRALAGFENSASGSPRLIDGAGYGEYDRFYEGRGMFNAIVGCNTWAADVLRAAGARTGVWNPLPLGLRWSLQLFGTCPPGGGQCRI